MKLEIHDLEKSYGSKEVLKNVNFTFEDGKIYGLLGRNGAGKTTFFNSLNNDISIDDGTFYLDDEFGHNLLKTTDIGSHSRILPRGAWSEERVPSGRDVC